MDVALVVVFLGEPAAFGGDPKPVHMGGRGMVTDCKMTVLVIYACGLHL